MKILLATSSVTPSAGIPSYNREVCSVLGRENQMHLLVDENMDKYEGYSRVISTFGENIYSYKYVRELLNIITEEKYDIIINSNSHVMSLITSYVPNSIKVITVSHSLGTLDCDNAVFNHKYVDTIISLSDGCKKYITKKFRKINKEKIVVVFNSIRDSSDSKIIREKKKDAPTINIVFAGGTAPSKSPDIVVGIIKQLCKTNLSFKFYWLGITTPPFKKMQPYDNVCDILPNDKRIIVTGLIPQRQAAEIIANCNIFLAPSRREGFPMALLEAMRIGCIPIVADFEIANKEIIDDGENGFVIPHQNIQGFVERICDIITHPGAYASIYDYSYRTFIDRLSFPVWEGKMNRVLSDSSTLNHKTRKRKCNRLDYLITSIKFFLLDKWDLLDNFLFETLPCAIDFYRFYKQKNK